MNRVNVKDSQEMQQKQLMGGGSAVDSRSASSTYSKVRPKNSFDI